MATGKTLGGKPYAGNPHVQFDEGVVASAATPRRGSATRFGKFDAHRKVEPLTAIIMEATIGMGKVDDYRIFNHSTVEQVLDTVKSLTKSGAYKPPKGQNVYINHLAKTLHPEQAVLNKTLPEPIKAAYDCLEVVMR